MLQATGIRSYSVRPPASSGSAGRRAHFRFAAHCGHCRQVLRWRARDDNVLRQAPHMKRIMIVGQPGSGKSTLARRLGDRTRLPVVHIDKIHWLPGWIERSRAEKTRLCNEAAEADHWIFEGGHSETWAGRIARADMLIWLDRPIGLRLWRVVRRSLSGRGKTRPDLAEDCPERLRLLPEFILFIWKTRRRARLQILQLASSPPRGCEVVRLCSDREIDRFVQQLSRPDVH